MMYNTQTFVPRNESMAGELLRCKDQTDANNTRAHK